jgi:formylglycine-generating enzyme required for sulfatase activity
LFVALLSFNAASQTPLNIRVTEQNNKIIVILRPNVEIELIKIPSGSFMMGSDRPSIARALKDAKRYAEINKQHFRDETPQRLVNINSFYMSSLEIGVLQYKLVNGEKIEKWDSQDPVNFLSWVDVTTFCNNLTALTGRRFRLPTEAEWEYAARAGTTTDFFFGNKLTRKNASFGYLFNSNELGIGSSKDIDYTSNSWGLFDMHGSVAEWCQDIYYPSYKGLPTDGTANFTRGSKGFRVIRGGNYYSYGFECRSATRSFEPESQQSGGIRLVMSIN